MKKILAVAGINLLLLLPVLYGAEYFLRSRERVEPRDTYLRLGWKPLMPVWMGEVARLQDASRSSVLGGIPRQKKLISVTTGMEL